MVLAPTDFRAIEVGSRVNWNPRPLGIKLSRNATLLKLPALDRQSSACKVPFSETTLKPN